MDVDDFAQSQSVRLGPFFLEGRYSIPDLQRNYSWSRVEGGQLWTDLLEHLESGSGFYFLGSIVFFPHEKERLVVDGQQRMATVTVLLCAIRDALRKSIADSTLSEDKVVYIGGDEIEIRDQLAAIETHIKKPGTRDQFLLRLKQRDAERLDWIQTRHEKRGKQPHTRGGPNIYRVFEQYTASTQTLLAKGELNRLCDLSSLIMDRIVITRTRVDTLLTAYTIFSTMNTRGQDLTLADIVRSEVMAKWQKISKNSPPASIITLLNQFEVLEYDELPQFMRRFWVARTGKTHSPSETSKRLVNFIRADAKTKADLTAFVKEMAEYAAAYAQYLDIAKGNTKADADQRAAIFGLTKFQQHIPTLVSLLKRGDFKGGPIHELLGTIESIYLYLNILLDSSPSEVEEMFAQAAHAAYDDGAPAATKVLRDAFEGFLAKEQKAPEWFASQLTTTPLSEGSGHFLLRTLEKERWSGELKFNFGRPKELHLEHILPKEPDKAAWGKKWHDEEYRNDYLWLLGNLTLLANRLNQGASNSGFDVKKNEYYGKSDIKLTKQLTETPNWDEGAIEGRTGELSNNAAARWAWTKLGGSANKKSATK